MELHTDYTLLRIFVGEIDKLQRAPLYKTLVLSAQHHRMAGCVVLKGVMSFGAGSRVHTAKLIDVLEDLPIIVEIIDKKDRIEPFLIIVNELMEQAGCGGLITTESVTVLYYKRRTESNPSETF